MLCRKNGGAIVIAVLLVFGSTWARGEPLDRRAVEQVEKLHVLANAPVEARRLSDTDRELFTTFARGPSGDLKLVGILGLAYAQDVGSHTLLKGIESGDDEFYAGVASYALTSRELRGKAPEAQFELLRKGLENATNPYARLFLANRLAVDFKEPAIPIIVKAMQAESDEIVRCDMLYYVVKSQDFAQYDEVLKLNWDERIELPENCAYIMAALTPGRSKDTGSHSACVLLAELRARQAAASSKEESQSNDRTP